MTFRIVLRRAARTEFEDAAIWYEGQRHGLGEEFTSEVDETLAKIAESPTRYPIVFRDVRRTVTRRFPFAIYFRLRGNTVVVLAIFHGRRDPHVWQRRT